MRETTLGLQIAAPRKNKQLESYHRRWYKRNRLINSIANNTTAYNPNVRTSGMKSIQGGNVGTAIIPQEGGKKNRNGRNGIIGEAATRNWRKVKINIFTQGKNNRQSGPTEHALSPVWRIDRADEKRAKSNNRPITKCTGPTREP